MITNTLKNTYMTSSPLRALSIVVALISLVSCGDDSADPAQSDEKSILNFSINGTEGTIDQSLTTISLELLETDLTNLTPEITISANAEISPASGVSQDFTNPVTYTVTAVKWKHANVHCDCFQSDNRCFTKRARL